MKLFTHIHARIAVISLLVGALFPSQCTAQSGAAVPVPAQTPNVAATVRSVRVIADSDGPAIEVISSRPLVPTIGKLAGPSRLVVDLAGASIGQRQRIPVSADEISAVRVDQYQYSPPVVRMVVDLLQPVTYTWDAAGNRLMVRLHSMVAAKAKPTTASVAIPAGLPIDHPAIVQATTQPPVAQATAVNSVVVPAAAGKGASSGAVRVAGSRIAGGSSLTAGADTAILSLSRGGQIRVCTGTTVSVTPSQNGQELMLGMSTGALEAHYRLEASADSVLTPDFRILLAGPGEFHYAISADSRGNTCVRTLPGNTASVMVSELMGNGTYQVKPNEQIVFRSGRLTTTDTAIPGDCGCPASAVPVMRASGPAIPVIGVPNSEPGRPPAQVTLSMAAPANPALVDPAPVNPAPINPGPETALVPASASNDVHIQVDAPFVFRATDPTPSAPAMPTLDAELVPLRLMMRSQMIEATVLPPQAPPSPPPAKAEHRGFFRSIGRFFAAIFR